MYVLCKSVSTKFFTEGKDDRVRVYGQHRALVVSQQSNVDWYLFANVIGSSKIIEYLSVASGKTWQGGDLFYRDTPFALVTKKQMSVGCLWSCDWMIQQLFQGTKFKMKTLWIESVSAYCDIRKLNLSRPVSPSENRNDNTNFLESMPEWTTDCV